MKKIKKIGLICLVINIFLVLQMFGRAVLALESEEPAEQEIVVEEIQPTAARGACDDYTYYNLHWTMDNVAWNNGWTLDFYNQNHANIYNSSGKKIGRYDLSSSFGQNPHFHIDSTAGMHYWVYF